MAEMDMYPGRKGCGCTINILCGGKGHDHDDDHDHDDKKCHCKKAYFNLYATKSQFVPKNGSPGVPGDAVIFDAQNAVFAPADFDLTQAGVSGAITFLYAGDYDINWEAQAKLTPPLPAPAPSWAFGLYLNGVLVPGSVYGGFNDSPNNDAIHADAGVIISVKAGDVLLLRNVSTNALTLTPVVNGLAIPATIASLTAVLVS